MKDWEKGPGFFILGGRSKNVNPKAMKRFLFLLLSFVCTGTFAQTKSSAAAQQEITFRLLPVEVVERVSADSPGLGTKTAAGFMNAETGQKWAVQLKKLSSSGEQSYALFSAVGKKNRLPENLSPLQLCTVSKP